MWAVGLSLTVLSGAARAQMAFAPVAEPVVKTPAKTVVYTISGSVTDAVDGGPIPGVYVTAGKYGAQTDAQGRFLIKDVPAGRYTVRTMYYSAYTSDQTDIDLQADVAGLSLKIKEQALALGEVVVTGTRTERHLADVPVLTTVIPSREIEKSAATSVLAALEDVVPGIVSSDNAMGNNLRIKGLNSRYILFLVDGERLVSEGAGGNVNLDQIDVNQIERIEVVQGAASALYGSNAVGAIINIITKAPVHKVEAGAKATWETPNELRVQADVGSRFKDVTLRANAFRNASAGFDADGGAYAAPYTDYGAQLKTAYKPTEQWRLNLDGRYYRHEVFNPENSLNTTHGLDQKMSLGAGAEWRARNEKHVLRLSANWDKYFDDEVLERKQNEKSRQNVNDYLSARLLHTFHINTKWELVSGLEYNHESNYALKT
ncbi:MAG: TonB-dependent receptor, partial [Bacteroidales bacterium]|nr:TonB-dependent receptor [Bacteroidales bacterium]